MVLKLTQEQFIEKSKSIHGDKYNYDQVKYINYITKVIIYCNFHKKNFIQTPSRHINGSGCYECGRIKSNTSDFIEKAKKIHKNNFNYDQVVYKKSHEKVIIFCIKRKSFFYTNTIKSFN